MSDRPDPLPALPQCTYLVDEEAKRHGMHPAYRNLQNVMKYGGESTFEQMFSADDMRAYARVALQKRSGVTQTSETNDPKDVAAQDRIDAERLTNALQQSLALQSHYAYLLNMRDGGERRTFPTVASWIDRLAECDAARKAK